MFSHAEQVPAKPRLQRVKLLLRSRSALVPLIRLSLVTRRVFGNLFQPFLFHISPFHSSVVTREHNAIFRAHCLFSSGPSYAVYRSTV